MSLLTVCKSLPKARNEQTESAGAVMCRCKSSTQKYEFVKRIAALEAGQQELALELSGDKENVL
jgi:hypothetical protein